MLPQKTTSLPKILAPSKNRPSPQKNSFSAQNQQLTYTCEYFFKLAFVTPLRGAQAGLFHVDKI